MDETSGATAIETAERVLAELVAKRDTLAGRMAELSAERQRIAFVALAGGDAKARKHLDQLNTEGATLAGEAESIEAAIAEAIARVAAAQNAEALAADREQAAALRAALGDVADCARKIDGAFETIVAESQRYDDLVGLIVHKLGGSRVLGGNAPNVARIFALRALETMLGKTPWRREFRPVPPLERRSFSDLICGRDHAGSRTPGWAERIEADVAARLGETGKAEAA